MKKVRFRHKYKIISRCPECNNGYQEEIGQIDKVILFKCPWCGFEYQRINYYLLRELDELDEMKMNNLC